MWWLGLLLLADSSRSARAFRVPLTPTESLSVETAGSGEAVVLMPGLFGSAFGFRKLVPLLNDAGYRTIVIEPLGIGASARPEKANYSLAAQAERVAAVLDTLRVRGALLVGHSIGGAEAFRLAYRRPDLVKGVISIESGPTEATITPAFKRALRFAPWIRLFGGVKLVRRKIRNLLLSGRRVAESQGHPQGVPRHGERARTGEICAAPGRDPLPGASARRHRAARG